MTSPEGGHQVACHLYYDHQDEPGADTLSTVGDSDE